MEFHSDYIYSQETISNVNTSVIRHTLWLSSALDSDAITVIFNAAMEVEVDKIEEITN